MKFSQNSKCLVKIRNSKFTSMHTLVLSSNLLSVTFCLSSSYLVPMRVMRKYSARPQRICSFFLPQIQNLWCRTPRRTNFLLNTIVSLGLVYFLHVFQKKKITKTQREILKNTLEFTMHVKRMFPKKKQFWLFLYLS